MRTKELNAANANLEKANEKIRDVQHLYAFISQVNQNIVRVNDQETLFRNSCRMALEFGKFKMAWIGLFNENDHTLSLVQQDGVPENEIGWLTGSPIQRSMQEKVLLSGSYQIYNDIINDTNPEGWAPFARENEICSCMILPIRCRGKVIGTLNLYSAEAHFSFLEEIDLLVEVATDISFALDLFENSKRQKAMEERLFQKEKQLEFDRNNLTALINNTTDLMWSVDKDFNLITSNKPFDDIVRLMSGKKVEKGSNILSAGFSLENLERYKLFYERAFSGESFSEIESGNTPQDFSSEISFYPIRKGNEIIGTACFSRNITEKKLAEANLVKSEARLKEAQALAKTGNWEIDLVTDIHTWSDELYSLFGITKDDIEPSTEAFLSFMVPEDAGRIRAVIRRSFEELIPSSYHFRFVRKDGTTRYGYTERKFELDKNNKPLRVFGIMQDETDRKNDELMREKISADIVRRNKDLEQFSYIVSHDMRAPVANIIGISDALSTMELDEKDKLLLTGDLITCVKKLDMVITDLNSILQVNREITEKKEMVNFSGLLADIQQSISELIRKEDVQFVVDFTAVDEMPTLKSYLYSIFLNLISNSIRYRHAGRSPVITIKSERTEKKIRLVFTDNGIGMDIKKSGGQVFGLYKRFHTHVEGKGMGLYMVKTQVESLGGKITVKSEVNKGTEFRIEFETE